jgi:DNA-binding HxlR family transcriptional regulator
MNCSIARSLEVIGEWWTLPILRDAFFASRASTSSRRDWGSPATSSPRGSTPSSTTACSSDVLRRSARARHDYVLTDKGRALWPVLVTIRQWGDEWLLGAGNEPVAMIHTTCGAQTAAVLTCDHCGEQRHGRDVRVVAGPGTRRPNAAADTTSLTKGLLARVGPVDQCRTGIRNGTRRPTWHRRRARRTTSRVAPRCGRGRP